MSTTTNTPQDIGQLLNKIKTGNLLVKLSAIGDVFNLMDDDANLFEIHRLGGIPIIISLLNEQQSDKRIVKNIVGILLNMATLDKCRNDIKSGISMIFKVIESHLSELVIVEYGIGTLVNLCEDNDESIRKEMVNQENSIKVFTEILKDVKFTEEMKRNVLSLISFLSLEPTFITKIVKSSSNSSSSSSTATTGKYMAQKLQNSANDQSILRNLVKQIDISQVEQIRSKTVFCVYNLIVSDDENGSIQNLLVKEGFVEKMISILENPSSENNECISNCLMSLSFVCEKKGQCTEIQLGKALKVVSNFLTHAVDSIAQSAAGAVGNIVQNPDISHDLHEHTFIMTNLVAAFRKFTSKNKTALEHVLSSIVSLCYASPEMSTEFSQSKGGLIILTNFLRDEITIASQKPSCFNMATSLLIQLTNQRENIEPFRECGFVKLIAEWFSKSPCPIPQSNIEPYNAALFNMTKNAENQKVLLSLNIVPQLIRFANGKDKQASSFAAKSLWNLSATDMKCREDIRKEGINDATLKQLAGIKQ